MDATHGPGRRPQRADRAVRRHRPGRLVAVRRADRDADDAAPRRRRADLHAVAHHGAVQPDPLVPADRAQPPPERLRLHRRGGHRVPRLERLHPEGERVPGRGPAPAGLQHVLGRQEPQRAVRRLGHGRLQVRVAAGPRLRPLLRVHRRRDRPVVSQPGRRQPLRRAAVLPRGRLPPVEGPRRQGADVHPRLPAVAARQAVVHVLLPGRQPRPAPRARRSTSRSTPARSTTATRRTASGCCRG